jgi:hypothetical protein
LNGIALKAGMVLGLLYGILSLVIVPVIVFGAALNTNRAFPVGTVLAIFLPVLYGAVGFIFGVIFAALYNLVAKLTGGLEFEVGDVPAMEMM